MLNKDNFIQLSDRIINSVFADEKNEIIIYKKEGREWVDALYDNRAITDIKSKTSLGAATSVMDVINAIGTLVGTYEMVKHINSTLGGNEKKKESLDISEIKKMWRLKLIGKKVPKKTADKIVNEFIDDLSSLL